MSVYCLLGGLRRWVAGALPSAPTIPRRWLRVGFGLSLAGYLALKLAAAVVGLPPEVDLALLPAGLCALGLAAGREDTAAELMEEEGEGALRPALLAGLVLVAFTTTYLALNTVPVITSQDESAIVNGAHQLATERSLRITNPLNERYDTNIIGALHVAYRTPTQAYYRAFPGTEALYAPFSVLPGDWGYRLFTTMFGTAAIVALYVVAWKMLGSWPGGLMAALVFAVSPAFGHWAVAVYNNVPVLSLELAALGLVLWSTPPRGWQLGLAGAMMALAVLLRITEFVFVLPMLALVWWRCRSWSRSLPFALAAFSCVPLVLLTNAVFFRSPFFFPHVGMGYLPLDAADDDNGQSLLVRYFLFIIGVHGSVSDFHPVQKLDNILFHIRYVGSSTFAFPFLAAAFTGLVWWLAARRRNAWLLASAVGVSVAAIFLLYGHQHDNYYGYGLPIARSAFVRYSLPIYSFLAITTGAFFMEAARALRLRGAIALLSFTAIISVIGVVGIAQSYDRDVYGFNRLNTFREDDRVAWHDVDAILQQQTRPVLLIVGFNSMKLVDASRYPDTINYSTPPSDQWDELLFPVVTRATEERPVYLLLGLFQAEAESALAAFEEHYQVSAVIQTRGWALYRVEPPIFELSP